MSEPILIENPMYIVDARGVRKGSSFTIIDGEVSFKERIKSGRIVDARNRVVSIGFYNCHSHIPMILLAGFYSNLGFWPWLKNIISLENKLMDKGILNDENTYYSSLIYCSLLARSGCCGIVDMYYYWWSAVNACEKIGLRIMSGPPNPNSWSSFRREISRINYNLFTPIINMHSLYGVDINIIKSVVDEIRSNIPWIKLHIHVSETRDEVYGIWSKYGKYPIQLLEEYNLIDNSLLVHLCWTTYSEIELLKHRRCFMAHCPTSNALLYTGSVAPIVELDEVGVVVTLGTDGFNPSYEVNLRRVAKDSVLQLRQQYWSAEVSAWDVYRFLAVNGAKLFGVDNVIAEGRNPDIVLMDIVREARSFVDEDNLIEFIVYSPELTPVRMVIVNGNIIYDSGFNSDVEKEITYALSKLSNVRRKVCEFMGEVENEE